MKRNIIPGATGLLIDYGQSKAVIVLDDPFMTSEGEFVHVQVGRRGDAIVPTDRIQLKGEGYSQSDLDLSKFVRASSMRLAV